MKKISDEFFEVLGQSESRGNYKAVNSIGYIGKYQMGESALVDASYYKPKKNYNNKWDGEFPGKDNVYIKEDFLNNPQAQENAIRIYMKRQWGYIKNIAEKHVGQTYNGVKMTRSGMLAAAHLVGNGALRSYLQNEGKIVPQDKNGVTAENYIKKFNDFDVSSVTGVKNNTLPKDKISETMPQKK